MSDGFAPPREGLFRMLAAHPEIRADATGDGMTLSGHFAVFDTWTEIDSWMEGHFMERIAPGAFRKTFAENRANMRVLLQHGMDPELGDKPLGTIEALDEDRTGAAYEVRLFSGVPQLVLDGLRANQYGASFRFRVLREDVVRKPDPSDYNPEGIPERTVREVQVMEFGPVTWGAYPEATAGLRSLTDEVQLARLVRDPKRLHALMKTEERVDSADLSCVTRMINLGAYYIDEQDEDDDQQAISTMEEILTMLSSLVDVEIAEQEPPEADDPVSYEYYSAPDDPDGESRRAPKDTEDSEENDPATAPAEVTATRKTADMYLSRRTKQPRWLLP